MPLINFFSASKLLRTRFTASRSNKQIYTKFCSFLYQNYYQILIILPIFVPFCTHCILGMVTYFWIFLFVIVGFPLIYLLIMLFKDCVNAFVTVYILKRHSNFGSSEHLDELRYKQSDRLILGADIITRLIIYFIIATSFNYGYLFINALNNNNNGTAGVLTVEEYFGVMDQEFEYRDNICFYSHVMENVQNILIFFSFL